MLDKFYTKRNVANKCFNILQRYVDIGPNDIILEPSAGNGSFVDAFVDFKYEAYDIAPEREDIVKQDYLLFSPTYKDYITVGNPPFGHRNKMAITFFNKAATMSKVIAFIIPNTFLKWSVQKHLDPNFKLIYTEKLEANSFLDENKDFSVNCVFQIWIRSDVPGEDTRLKYNPTTVSEDFNCWQYNATEAAKKYVYENWDYAFWRQGYNDYNDYFTSADKDKVIDIVNNTNKQVFFVQCLNDDARKIIPMMDIEELAHNNLSTPGFGKADFIMYYTELKNKIINKP